jgi:hypothetical protein
MFCTITMHWVIFSGNGPVHGTCGIDAGILGKQSITINKNNGLVLVFINLKKCVRLHVQAYTKAIHKRNEQLKAIIEIILISA